MFSERFQIVLTPQQKRVLQREAVARGTTVSALIRSAIDKVFVSLPDDVRRKACQGIVERRVRFVPPSRLDELIESRFD